MIGGSKFNILLSIFVTIVCIFLVAPSLVVIPISFTETSFIMFPPKGFSLEWYEVFFTAGQWRSATATSFVVAIFTAIVATIIGTCAALGLRALSPRRARPLMWLFLLPMIIPSIVTAVSLYGAFSTFGLIGSLLGLVVAHTIITLPFVIINVSAICQKIDWRIVDAARSLGANPFEAFAKITCPAILPGILAGAVFAFLTSFDEIVVTLFLSGSSIVTLPVRMWNGIRFEISPAIAAASTILLMLSVSLLALAAILRRGLILRRGAR